MKARFRFENLTVWQAARVLNQDVYRCTKQFPNHELYALTSQLRRASVSITSNIAEGAGRNSDKDFARFLEQAYGSLMEVASQLYLTHEEKYLSAPELELLLDKVEPLAKQIAALNKSLAIKTSKVNAVRDSRLSTLDPRLSTTD